MENFFNLQDPKYAYMFGFIQGDGSLYKHKTRNRGMLTIEINKRDKYILKKFKKLIPYNSVIYERTRNTNFKKECTYAGLRIWDLEFRTIINELGIPYGKKSNIIKIPDCKFSEIDYFRGLIDADGSVGITKTNLPFVSLTVSSKNIVDAFIDLIEKITGYRKTTSRNERDQVFNIVIFRENAQLIVSQLYYDGCLSLPRKMKKAKKVLKWERPKDLKKRDMTKVKRWTREEEDYIIEHTIDESMEKLGRSEKSVKMKLWKVSVK